MSVQTVNEILRTNNLLNSNKIQQTNNILRPTSSSAPVTLLATATFSAAQILNLKSTPILVLSAPGPGLAYQLVSAVWEFVFGSAPFTFTGAGPLPVLAYGSGPFPPYTLDAGLTANAVIVNSNTSNLVFSAPSAPSTPWPSSSTINQPMYLTDEGTFSGLSGGTGCSLNLRVYYRVVGVQ